MLFNAGFSAVSCE